MKRKFDGSQNNDPKRRKIEKKMIITKISAVCAKTSKIVIVGRGENNKRYAWVIFESIPYVYHLFDHKSVKTDEKSMRDHFFGKYSRALQKHGVFISKFDFVEAKPLKGYEDSLYGFMKSTLKSEMCRFNLCKMIKELKIPNIFEAGISFYERFLSDTGIKVGQEIDIIEGTKTQESISSAMILSGFNGEVCSTSYQEFCKNIGLVIGHKLYRTISFFHNVATFRIICRSALKNKRYPVALPGKEVLRERFVTDIETDPITDIIVCTKSYKDNVWTSRETIHFATFSTNMKLPKTKLYKVFSNELELITHVLKVLKESDIVVGWRITDSLEVNSYKYLLKRLAYLGRFYVQTDILIPKDIKRLISPSRGSNTHYNVHPTPFFLVSTIDLCEYAEDLLQYKGKGVGEGQEPLNTSFPLLSGGPDFGINYMTDETVNIQTEIKTCLRMLEFVEHKFIVQNAFKRSAEWNIDVDKVFSASQTSIYKGMMLRKLGRMKKEHLKRKEKMNLSSNTERCCSYYVICESVGYHNNCPKDPSFFVDEKDSCTGGRTIEPAFTFVKTEVGTVDASNNYPGIICGAGLDPTSIVMSSRNFKEFAKKKIPLLFGKIGKVNVGFVQSRVRKYMPLISLLEELIEKRKQLRVVTSRGGNRLSKIEESVVKKSLVSITGCLGITRFPFILECFPIAETLRWMARQRFDFCVSKVKEFKVVIDPETKVVSLVDRNNDEEWYRLMVVAGHTDGFDVVLLKGDQTVGCGKQIMSSICEKLCEKINREVEKFDYGFLRNIESRVCRVPGPKFKIEKIASKIIYLTINDIVWKEDDRLMAKGNVMIKNIRNCNYCKCICRSIYDGIFKNEKMTKSVDEIIENRKKEFVRNQHCYASNSLGAFVRCIRVTKNYHEGKFEPKSNDASTILNEFQKIQGFEIPAVGQFIRYVYVKPNGRCVPVQCFDPKKYFLDIDKYLESIEDCLVRLNTKL
jgi:DNA polymerase elongation subunit (family B)